MVELRSKSFLSYPGRHRLVSWVHPTCIWTCLFWRWEYGVLFTMKIQNLYLW